MSERSSPFWQIWIDTGGTFTDCIAKNPKGETKRLKILSSSVLKGKITYASGREVVPEIIWPSDVDIFKGYTFHIGHEFSAKIHSVDLRNNIIFLDSTVHKKFTGRTFEITAGEEVPVLGARILTGTSLKENFPVLEMKLGSTRGTNAILEKKGARTAFLITKGFEDLLLIGNQQRPDLFALHIVKQLPLYHSVIEVDERIESDGTIHSPIQSSDIERIVLLLKKDKIESVAIALLNSYKNPAHESELANMLAEAGFKHVSVSHTLSSQIKILSRAETTVANAYLDPIIRSYVSGIKEGLSGARLSIMTSAGNLVPSDSFFPKDSLLSGPAGGVVGAATSAKLSGVNKIIAFDMGGTSTDVSLYDERYDYRFESHVGNYKILSPSLAIETIAAGGGSICDFDGHRLTVGPHSAGASPGPACYGSGGPLTVTDVNVLLGRIDPLNFAIPIDFEKSREALSLIIKKINKATSGKVSEPEILESFIQIANEKMAEAIRKISIQQGHDQHDFTLLSFGGAGGQHACSLASLLGMSRILVPYNAGLLSAYGIGNAVAERFEERLVLSPWKGFSKLLPVLVKQLFGAAKKKLVAEGHTSDVIEHKVTLLYLRFFGQDATLEIEYREDDDVIGLFRKKYIAIFGHWVNREIEVESIRVIARVKPVDNVVANKKIKSYQPRPERTQSIISGGKKLKGSVFRWEDLVPGAIINGPSIVVSNNSTTVVDDGWTWTLDASNNAILARKKLSKNSSRHSTAASLELFTNRFTALAQDMGALLQRTSFSVNVKERLDFSCAVLDADGYLVVNAPHIPVHLGSMGVCVREVAKTISMKEGDVIITNHPAYGGSHLPDVTLIKPVFYKRKLVGYVANRAHHAEIGGKKPGSMPADARTLIEEGVVIAPMYLVKKGQPQWESVKKLLTSRPYPTRALEENLADLNGALAAVNLGEEKLQSLCADFGTREVTDHMTALRIHASRVLKDRIKTLKKKDFSAIEKLDNGAVLKVRIFRKGEKLKIDFSGTSKVNSGNLNATKAIVQSVVLYVLRLLVDQPLPMNEGLMDNVDLVLPHCLLNPDFTKEPLPAVVGGNTEVSQRLTDTLLKALELAACSQGTMNNFLFGNGRFGYYETICGGTGAVNGHRGTDAVHQHMTNTRITDPELLELRYPVRLEKFEIRKDSGGKGKWNGGNGITREITFKEELEINLLTQHRVEKPYGMKGGQPGKTGHQEIIRKDGRTEILKGMDSAVVRGGDRIVMQTPGGGAWGKS